MSDDYLDIEMIGERAAIGGYLPQYDEFAIKVYDAMLVGELEEIRVADKEENVGKVDDIVYVTYNDVFAYQLKWTNVDDTMSYMDFKALIPKIVDGWRKLRNLYPDKTVHPRLLTNKSLTSGDDTIKSLVGKDVGGFKAYEKELLQKLKAGDNIDKRWEKALEELKSESKLTEEEWSDFWKVFSFVFEYKQEIIAVSDAVKEQRVLDIIFINRMIQEMAARKEVIQTTREIIARLGWEKRFEPVFDHNLSVPEESYVPNSLGIIKLDACLKGKTHGYIFLKGTPGSGKSTLLTQWTKSLKNPSVRFYAFDFLNPSLQRNNDSSRGSGLTFLNDIVLLIRKVGIESHKTVLPVRDYSTLKEMFYGQMDAISKQYNETGIPFLIIVDGLDHITREYTGCSQKLMEVLPSPAEIPEGVIFVLGSQHYDHLGLNREIERESKNKDNLVEMPLLSKSDAATLCQKLLDKEIAAIDVFDKCWRKSQGHPLYLRYLLNFISVKGVDVLGVMDDTPEGIEDYYTRIIGPLLEVPELRCDLGLVARIVGSIHLDDVRCLCTDNSISIIKNKIWHLFRYDKTGQEISFFHNSFRQYLLNKTAEDVLTEDFSKDKDVVYYTKLSEHFKNRWDYGYYLYKAEKYDQYIEEITPESLFIQAQNYRPLWSIRGDMEKGVEIARLKKDPYLLVRYLLFDNQLMQMDYQDYSVFSLVEFFIHSGRESLAKSIIREGRLLHCSQDDAMKLAVAFYGIGDREEANMLFELSYPDFLFTRQEEHRNMYQDLHKKSETLKHWVKTAAYFVDWIVIEKRIAVFISYLQSLAAHDGKRLDVDQCKEDFILEYLDSLVEQARWDDFKEAVRLFSIDKKCQNAVFQAYSEAVCCLSSEAPQSELLQQFFMEAEKLFNEINNDTSDILYMASLATRAGQTDEKVAFYLNKVTWSDLGSFYQNKTEQEFDTLSPHIFYVKTRARLGFRNEMLELVPDDNSKEDNALMVKYARRVFSIANMAGKAMRGDKDPSFLSLVSSSIRFFDTLNSPVSRNQFSYPISQQRADFYRFVIDSAKAFGKEMLSNVAKTFEQYYNESTCKADSDSKRKTILALFKVGCDKDWCVAKMENIDSIMMEWKDVDGREKELLHQGKAWLELGFPDRAEAHFHRLIKESFGVGYRKDYQPSLFSTWIGDAIKNDAEHAIDYFHWMTSRLRHIDTITESKTCLYAAEKLLEVAFDYNLHSGLNLAVWLLNEEFDYFQSVSTSLLEVLLKQAHTEAEYKVLFRYYTDLHLYTDETYSYNFNSTLLRKIVNCGQAILGDKFGNLIPVLRRRIETNCSETVSPDMLKALDELLNPLEEDTKPETPRDFERKIEEARQLLAEEKKEEAWSATMKSIENSSPSGWSRINDGGTRIDACSLLLKIDEERGRRFTFDLFVDDILSGMIYGIDWYLDEILPLLTNSVDKKRLFEEEFAYMNRILRADSVCEGDKPNIDPENRTICEVMRDWLLFLINMPLICVSERAKTVLAHLYNESDIELIGVLPDNYHTDRLLLEIGCYLLELHSDRLSDFKELAKKGAVSVNYQYRLYSAQILKTLGEKVPMPPYRELPATYSMVFPESGNEPFTWYGGGNDIKTSINWQDVDSVMGVASHWCGYLSYCTGIERRTLNFRAAELMRKYGNTTITYEEADKNANYHYDVIGLRFSSIKSHAQAALDGMLEVAAELIDGRTVLGRYVDGFFLQRDFGNINIEACCKPVFIQRIAEPKSWTIDKKWIDESAKSPRLSEALPDYNDGVVMGEYSHIKKMGDGFPLEEY